MALLLRTALNTLRRQQLTAYARNQETILPAHGDNMVIGLDVGDAFERTPVDDVDDDQYLFFSTPLVPLQLDLNAFRQQEHYLIFYVKEQNIPNTNTTVQFICASDGNPLVLAFQLDIGTSITIDFPTHHLVLSADSVNLFDAEIKEFDKIVALKNRAISQAQAGQLLGAGQAAGGGHIFQHAPTSSQQHQFAKLSEISDLFTPQSLRKCFPGTATTDPVTASAFSMSAAVTHLKAAAHKTGLRTHDKIPDLSTLKWESFVQQNFGMDKTNSRLEISCQKKNFFP